MIDPLTSQEALCDFLMSLFKPRSESSGRKPKQPALLLPVSWQRLVPASQRLQIEMPGLFAVEDGFDDVRRQHGHAQHFGNPAPLQFH